MNMMNEGRYNGSLKKCYLNEFGNKIFWRTKIAVISHYRGSAADQKNSDGDSAAR